MDVNARNRKDRLVGCGPSETRLKLRGPMGFILISKLLCVMGQIRWSCVVSDLEIRKLFYVAIFFFVDDMRLEIARRYKAAS